MNNNTSKLLIIIIPKSPKSEFGDSQDDSSYLNIKSRY
jgi:hypothetical protein